MPIQPHSGPLNIEIVLSEGQNSVVACCWGCTILFLAMSGATTWVNMLNWRDALMSKFYENNSEEDPSHLKSIPVLRLLELFPSEVTTQVAEWSQSSVQDVVLWELFWFVVPVLSLSAGRPQPICSKLLRIANEGP